MAARASQQLELPIEGMTCAACAARIERRLNRLDGVSASVNYATERASVEFDGDRVRPEALLAAVEQAGYRARLPRVESDGERTTARARDLFRRLVVSAALGAPVLVLGMMPALQFRGWQWLSLVLATPVVFWGGWPFHRAALQSLRHRGATMDTLVSLGTLAAYSWSLVALLVLDAGHPGMTMPFELRLSREASSDAIYFEAAVAIVVFLLAGRWFEARAKSRAGEAIRSLLELGAKEARVLDADGVERPVAVADVRVGDSFVVRPGERVATDGVVADGRSAVDASILTGESVPVEVGEGDEVTGASVNLGGRIVVRATRVGEETALAQMARLVARAQSGKAPVQRLADRVAAVFVPVVITLSLATLTWWLVDGGSVAFAFSAAVAVLIVACPCALGLATPTALLVGSGRGAQLGIVIRGPEVLESTRRVDTILLDKTGTVTQGRMTLIDVVPAVGVERGEALRVAGSLEHASEHPIARAIADEAARVAPLMPVDGFRSRDGLGVEGAVDGRRVVSGRPAFLEERGIALPPELSAALEAAEEQGRTVVGVGWDGRVRALLAVADEPKPSSALAVRELRALGLRPMLLTGDNEPTARAVAAGLGIDEVAAEVLPAEKAAVVERLQQAGNVVAMVGDGVNDAPALAQADLGLAIGTGADVAIEASDLTLVSGDLRAAVDAIRLSRRTLATIKGNLAWAFAYNLAALPLAAAGYLNPLIAAAAMALSSVFVVSNSLRLRRFRSVRDATPGPA